MPRLEADPVAKAVGARVRALRHEMGFSIAALAERSGLAKGHLSHLERGLQVPTVATLARVARGLGLRVADVVDVEIPT